MSRRRSKGAAPDRNGVKNFRVAVYQGHRWIWFYVPAETGPSEDHVVVRSDLYPSKRQCDLPWPSWCGRDLLGRGIGVKSLPCGLKCMYLYSNFPYWSRRITLFHSRCGWNIYSPFLKFLIYFWVPIPWMIEIAAILSAVVHHWADFGIVVFMSLM